MVGLGPPGIIFRVRRHIEPEIDIYIDAIVLADELGR